MKEHWVFIDSREGSPMICSRAGIRIYNMDHEDVGPHLESRVPGLLIFYDAEKKRFRIVRLNDKTGVEVEGGDHFKFGYRADEGQDPDHTE